MDLDETTVETPSAVDVIRFVWLARMAAQQGDQQTARRWQAKADRWLQCQEFADLSEPPGSPFTAGDIP